MEFEIFKTGTHTSDNGLTKTYTEEDLKFIAESYDPNQNEAPIVIGHPADNSPAYGWVDSLTVSGDKLIAKAKQIIPEFVDAVKSGLYKKRSISLDKDGKLRHVGFLGGAAPAVKGLADIQFSESPADTFELDSFPNEFISHPEINDSNSAEHLPPISEPDSPPVDGHTENNGQDIDNSITSEQPSTSDSDEKNPLHASFDFLQSELSELKTLITDINRNFMEEGTRLSDDEKKKIHTKIDELRLRLDVSGFELMLNEKLLYGSFTPAMKKKILSLCSYLTSQNFAEVSVTEHKEKVTALLKDFIDSVPRIIHYENFAEKPENEPDTEPDNYSGLPVDENASALHKKALSLMQKDGISYLGAVLRITGKQV